MQDNIPAAGGGGGGGGAPTDATYLTKTSNANLSAELYTELRVAQAYTHTGVQNAINDLP